MVAPQNESKIPVGTVLVGKYRVTREIGRGGMAAVYEAVHLALGKSVAVKVLAAELSTSSVVIERFFREARAAASVKSPYIVDVYDSSRLEDGRPFIAMELLEGESLYDRMARVRIIDPQTTVRVIAQCAKGLMKAHAAGIVHRDLKPENIFLMKNEDGEEMAKLLDFGLAKFYAPVGVDEKTARLTREGAVFGTPAYMSPEQVKGQGNVDHRADLWALGCMAFECLIGRPVWNTDQGVAMTFAAIAAAAPPVPSRLRSDLPLAFDEWFKKALQRDPNNRFQTAKELADALAKALTNSSNVSLPNMTGDTYQSKDVAVAAEKLGSEHVKLEPPTPFMATRPMPQPGSPSQGSKPSDANPLSGGRAFAPSATEMPPTATPESAMPPGMKSPGAARLVVSATVLAAATIGAYMMWARILRPQILTPIVESTVAATPSATAPDSGTPAVPQADEPKWIGLIGEGQKLLEVGDVEGAIKRFKEAYEQPGGSIVAKSMIEDVRMAVGSSGPCRLAALAHPRMNDASATVNAERPSVAATAQGAVVAWSDDHEHSGQLHAYSVLLDNAGRPTSKARDITPEGNHVSRPSLLAVGDRMVLLYWDKGGREPGVRVRWLDAEGRISGASMVVGAARTGNYWPTIEKAPDGFFVAWQDDRDKDGDDLFLRRLGSGLEPLGQEMRITDYLNANSRGASVRVPNIAVANDAIFMVYKLERGTSHLIERLYLPVSTPELSAAGLEDLPSKTPAKERKDRALGNTVVVNEDRASADAPGVACGKQGCFVVWHGEKGGAYGAMMEPTGGNIVWRKKFAPAGGHPSLGVNTDGDVVAAYYEAGKVKLVPFTRDGIGAASTFAKVSGDQPRPWVAGGATKGEWFVAWQDFENAKTEPFVARLTCR